MNNAEAVLMVLGETKAQLESQKDLNKNLVIQLQISQESNKELTLRIAELENKGQ